MLRLPLDPKEDKGFWHTASNDTRWKDHRSKPKKLWDSAKGRAQQTILGDLVKRGWNNGRNYFAIGGTRLYGNDRDYTSSKPLIVITDLWINATFFPSNDNARAYTGYFSSSSDLLNRIWYAGAYTLQLSTIDPRKGSALIDYNRLIDHNKSPHGTWYSNFTISNGTSVTTDGAKRDRMVWPGDMSIAVPGIAVSTHDMESVRNALETIFAHQYTISPHGSGALPYAGPPMGSNGEFSDTYHLHTLLGTYNYVLYSGDLKWLRKYWDQYASALSMSIRKVDDLNLLHVTSTADWLRPGMSGHNLEASALLSEVLLNSHKLNNWLHNHKTSQEPGFHSPPVDGPWDMNDAHPTEPPEWYQTALRLSHGIEKLHCPETGLYADNLEQFHCAEPGHVDPQDGNSWVLLTSRLACQNIKISENLRKRWTKYGAPAPEFRNVISPFSSSFELLGHCMVGQTDTAVELMLGMWGYMLEGPGMTNSTFVEGYRVDGYAQYPAYWSPARGSHAHGWSTGPTTALLNGVLGIRFTAPGGENWHVKPALTKWLNYARGGYSSGSGKWEVKLKRLVSPSGQQAEALEVVWPTKTRGVVEWGGVSYFGGKEGVFKAVRWLDTDWANGKAEHKVKVMLSEDSTAEEADIHAQWEEANGGWEQTSEVVDGMEFKPDTDWKMPELPERPVGIVDWEVLEDKLYEDIPAGQEGTAPWHYYYADRIQRKKYQSFRISYGVEDDNCGYPDTLEEHLECIKQATRKKALESLESKFCERNERNGKLCEGWPEVLGDIKLHKKIQEEERPTREWQAKNERSDIVEVPTDNADL